MKTLDTADICFERFGIFYDILAPIISKYEQRGGALTQITACDCTTGGVIIDLILTVPAILGQHLQEWLIDLFICSIAIRNPAGDINICLTPDIGDDHSSLLFGF